MFFASLLKKRKSDEWLLCHGVRLQYPNSSMDGEPIYHGGGGVEIIRKIHECRLLFDEIPPVDTSATSYDRSKIFGYRSEAAIASHAIEMRISYLTYPESVTTYTGSIQLGGRNGRVALTFHFLSMASIIDDPQMRQIIAKDEWKELERTFECAHGYRSI
ncbi:MAG: hypothetical protein ABIS50_15490 [Luteolibacter sp.]|uniref:hypothetical protein n=1 Tax=Luteolibacter sp. TaxID=1962973 RepID=UPI003267B72E